MVSELCMTKKKKEKKEDEQIENFTFVWKEYLFAAACREHATMSDVGYTYAARIGESARFRHRLGRAGSPSEMEIILNNWDMRSLIKA